MSFFTVGFEAVVEEAKRQEDARAAYSDYDELYLNKAKSGNDECKVFFMSTEPTNFHIHDFGEVTKDRSDKFLCTDPVNGCDICKYMEKPNKYFKSMWPVYVPHHIYRAVSEKGKDKEYNNVISYLIFPAKHAATLGAKATKWGSLTDFRIDIMKAGDGGSYQFEKTSVPTPEDVLKMRIPKPEEFIVPPSKEKVAAFIKKYAGKTLHVDKVSLSAPKEPTPVPENFEIDF